MMMSLCFEWTEGLPEGMSAEPNGIAPKARTPEIRSTRRHFLLILGLDATVWILLLRFFFPVLSGPVRAVSHGPFRVSGRERGRVWVNALHLVLPRPLGFVILDLMGRLGTRGILIPNLCPDLGQRGLVDPLRRASQGSLRQSFHYHFLLHPRFRQSGELLER